MLSKFLVLVGNTKTKNLEDFDVFHFNTLKEVNKFKSKPEFNKGEVVEIYEVSLISKHAVTEEYQLKETQ